MSINGSIKKITVPVIGQMKKDGQKIAALTAYDHLMAGLLDEAGIDIILVGDSAGMVVAGFDSTVNVSMDMMIYHTAAVRRGVKRALLVTDMPFLSYQVDEVSALRNAGRCLKEAGAEAVKVEGGRIIAPTIRRMVDIGIPVMGHLGLTPQSINQFGGYGVVGRDSKVADQMLEDARALQEAGVFAMVLEKIPAALATSLTKELKVPTIGIGAGAGCDGQVLVSHDMLGIYEKFEPKFVRRYAQLATTMREAFAAYKNDVKSGSFPSGDESY